MLKLSDCASVVPVQVLLPILVLAVLEICIVCVYFYMYFTVANTHVIDKVLA